MENYKDSLDLLGPLIWLFVLYYALLAASFVFWIIMLIDALKRKYPKPSDRTRWLSIVIILGVFGAIWYYYSVKKKPADTVDFPPPPSATGNF